MSVIQRQNSRAQHSAWSGLSAMPYDGDSCRMLGLLARSEFIALKWGDFNWDAATLSIQRGVVECHVGDPKTLARRKPIPHPPPPTLPPPHTPHFPTPLHPIFLPLPLPPTPTHLHSPPITLPTLPINTTATPHFALHPQLTYQQLQPASTRCLHTLPTPTHLPNFSTILPTASPFLYYFIITPPYLFHLQNHDPSLLKICARAQRAQLLQRPRYSGSLRIRIPRC